MPENQSFSIVGVIVGIMAIGVVASLMQIWDLGTIAIVTLFIIALICTANDYNKRFKNE